MTLLSSFTAYAQPSLEQICESLNNAQVFIEYSKLRKTIQEEAVAAAGKVKTVEEYDKIRLAYDEIKTQYNGFLDLVRKDLSNFSTIKMMSKRPEKFAEKYSDEFHLVVMSYNDDFHPVVSAHIETGKSGPILDLVITAFDFVIDLIRGRKEMREQKMDLIMSVINDFFFKKLKMSNWEELPNMPSGPMAGGAPAPTTTPGGAPAFRNATVDVSRPLFDKLEGYLEFVQVDANLREAKMGFRMVGGKDIMVNPLDGITTLVPSAYYESTGVYADGTQFYLRCRNTAGMYVLALNSGNRVSFLYPYDEDITDARGYRRATARNLGELGKDVVVETLSPSILLGQNNEGETILPTPLMSANPPKPRYFSLRPPYREVEEFCVIVTRSELDVEETRRLLQAATGLLHERLSQVFGTQMVTPDQAGLTQNGDHIEFKATDNTSNSVLPIVFRIRRSMN